MSILTHQTRVFGGARGRIDAPPTERVRKQAALPEVATSSHPILDLMAAGVAGAAVVVGVELAAPITALMVAHVALWPVLMCVVERGPQPLVGSRSISLRGMVVVAAESFVLLAAMAWLVGSDLSPSLLAALVGGSALLTTLGHIGLRARRGQGATHRVLLAGDEDSARRMTEELARTSSKQLEVVGRCPATLSGIAEEALRSRADDVLLLPCAHFSPDDVRHLTWRLADQGRRLHLVTGLVGVTGVRTQLDSHCGVTLVNLQHSELLSLRRSLLQWLGRAAAILLLMLLAPVLLLIAAAIALESPGSPLFRQVRIGLDGRPFEMLKFRTMRSDTARPSTAAGDDPESVLFKLRRDPRITRLGALLRRYSLDELPQLLNVVRGEMALVGPRPALPDEVRRYETDVHRRLAVRPGMTGLWQVSGRSDLAWDETIRLDLEYVDNWTPGLDARILVRTVSAVVLHRGAY